MNASVHPFLQRCHPDAFARAYFERLQRLLDTMDHGAIARVVEALIAARERGARIFFIGNGGSAATASHFANDIGIGNRSWTKPFKAVSLVDNVAVLTAIANDHGYDQVFTLQLRTQMAAGDVLVAISASGNSPNVLGAVEWANANGAVTIGLTGFDGGRLTRLAQIAVHVRTDHGEYGPVEDVHMILDHLIGAYLIALCRGEDGAPA